MTDKEVMQMALRALKYVDLVSITAEEYKEVEQAVETLTAALAQPEQKEQWLAGYKAGYAQAQETDLAIPCTPKEWVGLTDEEYELMAEKRVTNYFFNTLDYAHDIEAKLKEKNT